MATMQRYTVMDQRSSEKLLRRCFYVLFQFSLAHFLVMIVGCQQIRDLKLHLEPKVQLQHAFNLGQSGCRPPHCEDTEQFQ
jgi:hypothetical protein